MQFAPVPMSAQGGQFSLVQSIFTSTVGTRGECTSISKIYFDPEEELVWIGNDEGYVTSFVGNSLSKYTSFKRHDQCVRDIVVCNRRLVTIGGEDIRVGSKQGGKSSSLNPGLGELLCTSRQRGKGKDKCIIVSGAVPKLVVLDLLQMRVVLKVDFPSESGPAFLRHSSRLLCCCTSNGHILTVDPTTMKVQSTLAQGSDQVVLDMDVANSFLVTCGMSYSNRAQQMVADKFVKVYNLRYSSTTQPIQVAGGPVLLRFMPSLMLSAGKLLVVTLRNQFQMIDIAGASSSDDAMTQIGTLPGVGVTSAAVSSTGASIAIGDGSGAIHMFAIDEDVPFNEASYETELETPRKQASFIDIDDLSQSLSFVPGFDPAPGDKLISDIDEGIRYQMLLRPRPPINPTLLQKMRMSAFIGYAPNSVGLVPNRVPYPTAARDPKTPRSMKGGSSVTPAFIRYRKGSDTSPMKREHDIEGLSQLVPKDYRRVNIKYSYLGVDDFNFSHYNKTNFCGLEIHIPNAYCNSMLQMFYFIGPLRKLAHQHSCEKEFCLVCELGFLFHNLDQVPGTNCQATNFLRAFRTIPQATALGLTLNDDDAEPSATHMQGLLQSWCRFMLAQIEYITRGDISEKMQSLKVSGSDKNTKGRSKSKKGVSKTMDSTSFLGTTVTAQAKCYTCKNQTERDDMVLAFELESPEGPDTMNDDELHNYEFKDLLKDSICRERHPKSWCATCNDYKTTQHRRHLKALPHFLALNCNTDKEKECDFWTKKQLSGDTDSERNKGWIPYEIRMRIDKDSGELSIEQSLEPSIDPVFKESAGYHVYDLVGTVNHIKDANSAGSFVAHIKVSKIYNKLKEGISHTAWYLFNDFAVKRAEVENVVKFDMNWNVPISLFYIRRGTDERFHITPKIQHNMSVLEERLLNDHSISKAQFRLPPTFTPIHSRDNIPGEGDLVALDAEFVSIAKEEAEIRSGQHKKATLKPAHMACARISAVYGNGPRQGQTLFDDYIKSSEPVVDYLTKYSGVEPGDLDPGISSKHLTTLKQSYSKLRLLELRGVKFCGHGLSKDFRVINISPPKIQVIDTVDIYHIRSKRKISLKYLALKVLGVQMQQSALGHDSVEDSVTALNLYRKYVEIKNDPDKSAWNTLLNKIYDEGQKVNFKCD